MVVNAAMVAVAAAGAVLLQVTTVARIGWPGPADPDIVVLLVVGLALAAGPRAGALCGFGAGLLVDLAPPADHAAGQWALVLSLLGYGAGLLARDLRGRILGPVLLGGLAGLLAPLVFVVVGAVLGDPRADLLATLGRLPAAALWTLLFAPLVVPFVRYMAASGTGPAETVVR